MHHMHIVKSSTELPCVICVLLNYSTELPCIICGVLNHCHASFFITITEFYMYSCYTQCVVKTILTMVLYVFSKVYTA